MSSATPKILEELSEQGRVPICYIKDTWEDKLVEPTEIPNYQLMVDEETTLDMILYGSEEAKDFPIGIVERPPTDVWRMLLDLDESDGEDECPVRFIYPIMVTPRYEFMTVLEQSAKPGATAKQFLNTMLGAIEHSRASADHGLVHGNIHPGNVIARRPQCLLTDEMVKKLVALSAGDAESPMVGLKEAASRRLEELKEVRSTAPITDQGRRRQI